MKLNLLLSFVILGQLLAAQTFTKVESSSPFIGVEDSSIAFSDIDDDGDQDVLITGVSFMDGISTELYINEGEGIFSRVLKTPFERVTYGCVAFSDVDGDGDKDVLITGRGVGFAEIAKLYTNEGGTFSEVLETPFEGVSYSSAAFSDIDNDGDNDVLITGKNSSGDPSTKLYINEGGVFSEVPETPFIDVEFSSIAFSDIDNDGDDDVLISGLSYDWLITTKLYINEGGVFSEVPETPFIDVEFSSITFSDIDSDGDDDVLITGRNSAGDPETKLYTNEGGLFNEVSETPFENVAFGSVAFWDIDSDGDKDLLLTGWNDNTGITKLYTNEDGTFSEESEMPFEGVSGSSIAFSDIDSDGDDDLLITGNAGNHWGPISPDRIAKLYINEGGTFSETIEFPPFYGVYKGSVAFSDIDNDGDNDVLIAGEHPYLNSTAILYTNEGDTFSKVEGTPFEGVADGSVAFSDIDNDGDEDVLITGMGETNTIAKLYRNENGAFIEIPGMSLVGVTSSSVAFSDIDGDGDKDVLITGSMTGSGNRITKLYSNEGETFIEIPETPFENVEFSSIAFSDVDGDGDEDVLITGANQLLQRLSKLYINEGGTFNEAPETPFERVRDGSIAFSDIDNDGDNDVLITGQNSSGDPSTKLYTNEGGVFTEVPDIPFVDVDHSSIAFSDIDSDGDDDVLITGKGIGWPLITKLYTNEGGTFSEVPETPFEGVRNSSIAFSDIDGDGDNDVLITGESTSGRIIADVFINNTVVATDPAIATTSSFAFTLYPNPVDLSDINIRIASAEINSVHVSIFDIYGRLLLRQQQIINSEQTFLLDISTLNKGMYLIQLDDGLRKGTQKLLIN